MSKTNKKAKHFHEVRKRYRIKLVSGESRSHLFSTSLIVHRWLVLSHWTPPTTRMVRGELARGLDLRGGNW